MEELAKKYSFKDIEEKQYLGCEKKSLFHGEVNSAKKSFSIVIPPPNVTGILHMGHALNNTIQDILIRYKKMAGFETLWMPGTDHAGIATQNVVERKLAKENLTRDDIGREKFLEHVWAWKQEYGSTIIKQLRSLGCACDWQRTRFTMDEGYSDAVLEVFIRLYDKGLIYRGNRIINWCPRCQTALSDEEAPHKDMEGFLYHLKYPLKDSKQFLIVATTRPETMLGDTAVAVHPQDERYKHLIGKTIILPLTQREIKIIADDFVDPAFGSGAVKVTPAHDPNDYAMGKRHDLEFINILHEDGTCNENAGEYNGRDRFEVRQAIIEDLKQLKLLEKIESHSHAVGHCYRCHTVIEPFYSKQWFVKMKPLSLPATEAVKDGRIKFHPDRWTKVYLNWMENIQDWCISRQIWWGHRLPVYYCGECGEEGSQISNDKSQIPNKRNRGIIVARERPEKCPDCGSAVIKQDPDVLDTWFSSWLWPFATFGWPFDQKTEDGRQKTAKQELDYFYPTAVLVTAPEIIFFWVARMIMAGFEFMQGIPFKDIYIHGTVRDDSGKKMSKSLGNSIDPLEIIADYGTDALRFSLISITAMGQDIYLAKEKFEFGRNFCNKIWNASRFILMNLNGQDVSQETVLPKQQLNLADAWILSRFNSTLLKLNNSLAQYRLNEAVNIVYEFFWHQLCDWYIEFSKLNIEDTATKTVLYSVLEKSLRIIHPFMPLISDEIWQKVTGNDAYLLAQAWPEVALDYIDENIEKEMQLVMDVCVSIRNLRSENNIKPKDKVDIALYPEDKAVLNILAKNSNYLLNLAKVENLNFADKNNFQTSINPTASAAGCVIVMSTKSDEGFDPIKEKEKINAQIRELNQHIQRKDKLLNNANYLKKAPADVVEKEKQSLLELNQEIDKLEKIKSALK
ncbi:MAG: valine--tRNA ligase [Candidatus Omnitrophica bacterium]|nr:valine--tRNA ligase [Candidatus Omnitrophota bacterium]